MVKNLDKDEKIQGDAEELTMHAYHPRHKWEHMTDVYKENERWKASERFIFFKLNKVRKMSHSNAKTKHMETNAGYNGRSECPEIEVMRLKR